MYLIMKCSELSDQFECDASREPFCLTEDPKQYGYGFEVYEVKSNNTFELVKEYDVANETGFAIVDWIETDDDENDTAFVRKKYPNLTRKTITKSQVKQIKKEFGFIETVKEIFDDISCSGSHGEVIGEKWRVFGEYLDNHFDKGI